MEIIPITKNKSENEPDNANSLLFTTKLINGSFAKIPNSNAIKRKIPPIILQNVFLFIFASPLFSLINVNSTISIFLINIVKIGRYLITESVIFLLDKLYSLPKSITNCFNSYILACLSSKLQTFYLCHPKLFEFCLKNYQYSLDF